MKDIVDNFVEVYLSDKSNFLKIAETLTRIGYKVPDTNIVIQLCYILHKKGKYYITHYKEMKKLDGNYSVSINDDDYINRNTIIGLLDEWELIVVKNRNYLEEFGVSLKKIKIVKFLEKNNFELRSNYDIGSQ